MSIPRPDEKRSWPTYLFKLDLEAQVNFVQLMYAQPELLAQWTAKEQVHIAPVHVVLVDPPLIFGALGQK